MIKHALITTISASLMFGCTQLDNWSANPNTASALNAVINGALAYTSGNTIGAAIDGVQAASFLVRSLQSTPQAANPTAVANAVTSGGASTALAAKAAAAVVILTQNGANPDAANEQVAKLLDAAMAETPN